MTKDGGRRIATSHGAVLGAASEEIFDPGYWAARGDLVPAGAGRGSAWFVATGQWVLRHYRRGGFAARLSADCYVWSGERHVRSFAEWRLLEVLAGRGLAVPEPIAARYRRSGLFYRCDLITRSIPGTRTLAAVLAAQALEERAWRAVGAAIKTLHVAGADHADLNAHNVLLDAAGAVSIVDFDRGRLRNAVGRDASARRAGTRDAGAGPAVGWAARNLARLHRSLSKLARQSPAGRFTAAEWGWLMAGYAIHL